MFDLLEKYRVSELHLCNDQDAGLQGIIAIHNTRFGPALGGCRFISYPDSAAACRDAVRLARGMSYKAALANVPQGGGKSVIMKPEGRFYPDQIFRAFGAFIEKLNGRYITAVDSGTSAHEMDIIRSQTRHVTSTSDETNPAIYTAQGVFEGIKRAVKHQLNADSLADVRVAVQGIGNVGMRLCDLLYRAGARLTVSDINQQLVRKAMDQYEAIAVAPETILTCETEVLAPCGLGGILTEEGIRDINASIIAGSANNQLASDHLGTLLHERGILYAPDYVINAGGLIYASLHHRGESDTRIAERTLGIANTLGEIFRRADLVDQPTSLLADRMAEERLYSNLPEAA